MQKNMAYHLVLELKPGDFMPIDINILTRDNKIYTSLQEIDNFTKKYTKIELINIIKENNIVPEKYLDGSLNIINANKYRYPVFYKDIDFSIELFLNKNITNKIVMNKFLNIFIKYNEDKKEIMQNAINNHNINAILKILANISYLNIRNIYFYTFNNIVK